MMELEDVGEEREPSCREQMCKKDSKKFMKYVESTTAHGVARVFGRGKSIIRRLFWAVVFLGAMVGCLYNVSDRIRFLVGNPTSTTIQLVREESLTFPAVTICNLNTVKSDFLQARGLADGFRTLNLFDPNDPSFQPECDSLINDSLIDAEGLSFSEIQYEGRQRADEFILDCRFLGRRCSATEDFIPVFTQLGYCYTFNSGRNGTTAQITDGTGPRSGLQVILNIEQYQYVFSPSFDAGVKVSIHTQDQPPQPNDSGIGVPVGRNAFITLKERKVNDQTCRNCKLQSENTDFNFLREEYNYSVAACLVDCFFSNLTEYCGCRETGNELLPDSSRFVSYPRCTIDDTCCLLEQYYRPASCNCVSACEYTTYDISTSYSAFPARNLLQSLIELLNETFMELPTDVSFYEDNFLSVSVYFESLNVEVQATQSAYGAVALLSDIGGQLGLFLGVSVISVMEFATWILDELKDRCCGVSERKIKKIMRTYGWFEAKEKNTTDEYHEYSQSESNKQMADLDNPHKESDT